MKPVIRFIYQKQSNQLVNYLFVEESIRAFPKKSLTDTFFWTNNFRHPKYSRICLNNNFSKLVVLTAVSFHENSFITIGWLHLWRSVHCVGLIRATAPVTRIVIISVANRTSQSSRVKGSRKLKIWICCSSGLFVIIETESIRYPTVKSITSALCLVTTKATMMSASCKMLDLTVSF